MRPWLRNTLIALLVLTVLLGSSLALLARKEVPERITYGMSFNVPYARELGLDPMTVLTAMTSELGVRHFRIAAHWNLIEPLEDTYDFAWMDEQLVHIEESGSDAIFAVGRRLPRWPECHVPEWVEERSWEEQKAEIREYITAVVNRYKDSSAITYWQVENEPYLTVFATEHCGNTLDEEFLREEIELVRSLDPTRPILVTDSGNLGTWRGAYEKGDAFGTSVYVYFWNPELGQFRTILPPWFYRAKENLVKLFYGDKETFLIELSLEPWLVEPVATVPLATQYSRMDMVKMDEILAYARDTRFENQYLWGAEWWYWLRGQGDDTYWNKGKEIFKQ
jgi:Beta-galactosidase